jgi:hypothetical protein
MRRIVSAWLPLFLVGAAFAMTGCGGSNGSDAPPPTPGEAARPQTPTPPPPPSQTPEIDPEEAPAPATVDTPTETTAEPVPGTPGDPAALIGTSWLVGDMHVTFENETEVFVKGGMVAEVAPDGLTARYLVKEDGSLEATAMGMTMIGQWDGTHLAVGGVAAQRQ